MQMPNGVAFRFNGLPKAILELRRSHRASHAQRLPQVLWAEDGGVPTGHVPRRDGGEALIAEAVFAFLGLIPQERRARVIDASFSRNYTTWLNLAFLPLAAVLFWRFLRTGGPKMLRMMNSPMHHEQVR